MALSGTRDLTRGNTMRQVIAFALPVLIGVLFQQLYNFVDTAVVGRFLGADKLGAVGSTGSINFLILGFCQGVCSGFSVPVSQRFGAGDHSDMRRYVINSVYLTAVLGIVLGISTALLCPSILSLMNTQTDLFDSSVAYIRIIFAAIPVTMVYNMAAGILRALGDSRTPVYFLILAALINVALDLLFIVSIGMDVDGAAVATVISQAISGIGCVIVLLKKFTILRMYGDEKKYSRFHAVRLLSVGLPMGLQFSITAIGAVVLQTSVNDISKEAVSAIAVGSKVSMLFGCMFDSLASTMATFAGQNLGAGKLKRIGKGLLDASILGTVYSVIATVILWTLGPTILSIFLDPVKEAEIVKMATFFLRANSSLYIFLLFVNIVRLTIQGMGFTRVAMIAGLLEMIARSTVGLVFVPMLGFNAAAFANPSAWIAADLFLFPCYFVLIRKARRRMAESKPEPPVR